MHKNEVELPLYNICRNEKAKNMSINGGLNSIQLYNNLRNAYGTTNLIYEESQERPDILLITESDIIGIEHFEFDDFYRKKNKGSTGKALVGKFSKEFEREAINKKTYIKTLNIEDDKEIKAGYNYFVNNFTESFIEHYNKIDEYISNISEYLKRHNLQKNIKIYFMIENASPFSATLICNEENCGIFTPFHSKEIRKIISNANKIDGIITLDTANTPLNIFYSREDCDINTIVAEELDFKYISHSKCIIQDTLISVLKIKKD